MNDVGANGQCDVTLELGEDRIVSMDLRAFEASLRQASPPAGLSPLLVALWHERKGDWERAHEIAQDITGRDGAWVHAYLHRREGDQSNAAYWYRHAEKPVARGALNSEWEEIVQALLQQ